MDRLRIESTGEMVSNMLLSFLKLLFNKCVLSVNNRHAALTSVLPKRIKIGYLGSEEHRWCVQESSWSVKSGWSKSTYRLMKSKNREREITKTCGEMKERKRGRKHERKERIISIGIVFIIVIPIVMFSTPWTAPLFLMISVIT